MIAPKFIILSTFFAFVLITAKAKAEEVACDDAGDEDCALTNQVCTFNGTENNCGECRNGFIQIRNSPCVSIEDLDIKSFFDNYEPKYSKRSSVTDEERLELLIKVAKYISEYNAQVPPPKFRLGLTAFTADTAEDMEDRAGLVINDDPAGLETFQFGAKEEDLPSKIDWVADRAVTSVKDQGRCGCCWAVSVAGAIEGAAAITSNFTYLQSVSFQQFISCNHINGGCDGGDTDWALLYANINRFGGMATLNEYPYTDEKGDTTDTCDLNNQELAVNPSQLRIVTDYFDNDTFEQRLAKMKEAVARQPISVVIKSACRTLSNYRKGVINDDGSCSCDTASCIDHAILLVGYNDDADTPYWVLKNSWGTGWGEGGYFRVAQKNPRGVNSWGLFGMLAHGSVPLQALNVTSEVYDKPQEIDDFETWKIILISVACIVVVIGVVHIVKEFLNSRRK
mmetsp:Transcript_11832/g.16775  ORF Transcript_11832/g.16775 Transcript_11832/m.16775 type:complete len:453 (-) Transcript_11832:80-1438(-)